MNHQAHTSQSIELLQFYADIGVDEVMRDSPEDWTTVSQKSIILPITKPILPAAIVNVTAVPSVGLFEALSEAKALAAKAETLEDLRKSLDGFEGLTLNRTSPQMVFADGNPKAKIMFIGEVPGMDDERLGLPFAGTEGQLLDKMLAAIGLDRDSVYISHLVNWRPPGGRAPLDAEIALSLPFIQRHIELIQPSIVIFLGGVAAKAMLQTTQSITRIRGKWQDYKTDGLEKSLLAMAFLHPNYLLASPASKAHAWADLLAIRAKLQEITPEI